MLVGTIFAQIRASSADDKNMFLNHKKATTKDMRAQGKTTEEEEGVLSLFAFFCVMFFICQCFLSFLSGEDVESDPYQSTDTENYKT